MPAFALRPLNLREGPGRGKRGPRQEIASVKMPLQTVTVEEEGAFEVVASGRRCLLFEGEKACLVVYFSGSAPTFCLYKHRGSPFSFSEAPIPSIFPMPFKFIRTSLLRTPSL